EYAGGNDLEAFGIRDHVFFGRAQNGVLESEFAGNLAEVCPTGVFTDATLKRHYTRKWDLRWTPSVCPHCALGCNTSLGERYGQVRVTVNRYNSAVNGYFLCDRGRFGYEYLNSPRRIAAAHHEGAALATGEALGHLETLLRTAKADPPGRLLGIGSPRASLESNFALWKLVGRERFFAGLGAGELEVARRILELLREPAAHIPSLAEMERCDAVVVLGEDLTQTAARLALSVRQALRQQPLRDLVEPLKIAPWLDHAAREAIQSARGPLFIATPAATRLDDVATECVRGAPDDLARWGFALATAVEAGSREGAAAALLGAQRPLIIAGTSCNSLAIIETAPALAGALRRQGRAPKLAFMLPECNTLGLALLDPRPLTEGFGMARFTDLAVIVENDLYQRAPAEAVDAFLAHFAQPGRGLVVLDQLENPTGAAADLLLPAAAVAESEGTLVSSEGRAQRFYPAVPADPGRRASWRWLEQGQGRDPSADEIIAELGAAFPELAHVADAAPPAGFRMAGQKVPRETQRASGRTARHADRGVSEPLPPQDRESPLSYTMEGAPGQPPAPVTPFFWDPGWNSPQATLTYQEEINGPLRGGDAGVRLWDGADGEPEPRIGHAHPPAPFVPRRGEWLLVRLFHLFGSEELSRQAEALAQLAPGAYVAVNAGAAAAAGWRAGQPMRLRMGERELEVPLRLDGSLPAGVAGVPAGFSALDGAGLPQWCGLTALPDPPAGGGAC